MQDQLANIVAFLLIAQGSPLIAQIRHWRCRPFGQRSVAEWLLPSNDGRQPVELGWYHRRLATYAPLSVVLRNGLA